jgi:hypothetical protein
LPVYRNRDHLSALPVAIGEKQQYDFVPLTPKGCHSGRGNFGMALVDWIVVAAYALGMLAVGRYYGRRNETAEDYHLGGRRMSPYAVGLSLFATLTSSLSYLAVPGEMVKNGPMVLAQFTAFPLIAVFPEITREMLSGDVT